MPAWLGLAGAVIGIVIFFGSVVVYLAGSKDQGTIRTLTDSNTALQQRVGVLESDNSDMKNRVTALEHENAMLKSQRPSADAIAALVEQTQHLDGRLDEHDIETKALIVAQALRVIEAVTGEARG